MRHCIRRCLFGPALIGPRETPRNSLALSLSREGPTSRWALGAYGAYNPLRVPTALMQSSAHWGQVQQLMDNHCVR